MFWDPTGLFTLNSAYYDWFFQKNPDANWMKNHQAYTSTMEDRGWKTPVAPSGNSSGGSSGSSSGGKTSSPGSGSGSSSGGKSSGGGGSLGYGGIGAGMGTYMPYVDPFIVIPPSDMIKLPDGTGQRVIDGVKNYTNSILDTPQFGKPGNMSLREELTIYRMTLHSLFFVEGSGDKVIPDGDTVISNEDNVYDNKPSDNHSTTSGNPITGEPNSSVDILDSKGNTVRRRWYGPDGKQIRDLDYTNHGNPKEHPEVPHEHGPRIP